MIPYVPERITVHLGPPDSDAANVTVPFQDYVKNVASSEIYPTWDESALRANILAIISFALNRVYTEFYRSRGYDFEITNSTAIDQAFVNGRNTFESVDRVVDDIFNDYIRRQNFVEPLAAKFCNGTTVTCEGLSQWGSQRLAQQGFNSVQILRNYYGDNIEIVTDAPIQGLTPSYPGTPLRQGSRGPDVVVVQASLNRISQNYPAIPKISPVDGIFGPQTEAAVRRFQEIFGLTVDGIVGKATWYELVRLYVGVNSLAELRSQGQQFYNISWNYGGALQQGSSGTYVRQLQYMLQVLSNFISTIPYVQVDGIYGPATRSAVIAAQRYFGLPQTGRVDERTWLQIESQFNGIKDTVFRNGESFPEQEEVAVMALVPSEDAMPKAYEKTTTLKQHPGRDLRLGDRDPGRKEGAV
ncbi:MAG: peptidoglycan-binding protein [Faecousia sp.]